MKKVLGIIGAGDLGKQIAYYATEDNHYTEVIFFDDFTAETKKYGFRVIGGNDKVLGAFEQGLFDELIIAIGYKHLNIKKQLFNKYLGKVPFGKIIHSSSWVDNSAKIGDGVVIYPKNSIDANVVISANSILNIACTIAHDTTIGRHCFLSPRVAVAGFVNVEEQTIIGINSTIIDNIIITQQTQIGGGTVVIKNIEKAGLYVGNPHRFIRKLK